MSSILKQTKNQDKLRNKKVIGEFKKSSIL